jgi:beta-N-acetylhexosaminidase
MTRRRILTLVAVGVAAVLVAGIGLLAAFAVAPQAVEQRVYPRSGNTPPPPPDPVVQYAADRLSTLTLEQKIATMLMVHAPGLDPAAWAATAASGVGGMILMGDNVPAPEGDLAAFTAIGTPEPGLPVLYAMDQEGGIVRRIFADQWASAYDLRFQDPSAARAAFNARGSMLQSLGVDINFGIIADVTPDPGSFIYERSLGDDAVSAAPRIAEAVAGESGTVLSTLKHFPGHGVSPGDSHNGIPGTAMGLDEWRANHAPPFAAGIDAGAEVVMFGHLRFDAVDPVPATLSATWHRILRDELGFDGIIVTDDMTMLQNSGEPAYADQLGNAIAAVNAGNTILLYVGPVDVPGLVAGIAAAVEDGRIDEAVIDDAARRLLELRRTLSGETGRFPACLEDCQAVIE